MGVDLNDGFEKRIQGNGFVGRIWKRTYMNSLNTLKTFQRKFGDAPVPRMSSMANAGCPANRIAHDTCKKNVGEKEKGGKAMIYLITIIVLSIILVPDVVKYYIEYYK